MKRFTVLRTVAVLSLLGLLAIPAASASETPKVVQVVVGADGETKFSPASITAAPGDVVRFVAFAGVHNVHFLKEANVSGVELPEVSGWLLREGDRYELKVTLPPGTYHFQCDPHAMMGMKGTLTITDS